MCRKLRRAFCVLFVQDEVDGARRAGDKISNEIASLKNIKEENETKFMKEIGALANKCFIMTISS